MTTTELDAAPPPGRRASDSAVRAYDLVKVMVESYQLKPGERINEIGVARQLGLSRTPLRQALAKLASDGFIEQTPNRGYHVRSISVRDVQDLYEARATIETGTFHLSCERAKLQDIEAVSDAWLKVASDPSMSIERVAEADETFHVDIVRLSSNLRLVEALQRINSLIRYFRRIDLETRREETFIEHAELIACLKARDPARGIAVMRGHFSVGSEHVISVTRESLARIFLNSDNLRT